MRERRIGKLMAPASKHRDASRPQHARANYASRHLHSGRGAGCRNFSRLPARGRAFSLVILFYRTHSETLRQIEEQEQVSPIEGLTQPELFVLAEIAGAIYMPLRGVAVYLV